MISNSCSSSSSFKASQIVGILEGPLGEASEDKWLISAAFDRSSIVVVIEVLDWLLEVASLIGI